MDHEPHCQEGQVKGLGMAKSNIVIGNRVNGERQMAAIVCNPKFEQLELAKYATTHFTTIMINTNKGKLVSISGYFQFADEIEPYLEQLQNIIDGSHAHHQQ